jgi:NAD(P)-dependent dehydrogenase (short-subunit alcohol dehydrogenase family)
MTEARRPLSELFDLSGRGAVVTGGAGLYGRQIAEALAEAGARTFIASRQRETLEQTARGFRDDGLAVEARAVDQSDGASARALLEDVSEACGSVDVLVNNAVLRPMKAWGDAGDADEMAAFDRSIRVNLTGVYRMTRLFGAHMAERGGGSIVNVSSIQGMVGPDFSLYEGLAMDAPPDYYVHKGGMMQLTRYAAARLGPSGVRVNAVSPDGLYAGQPDTFVERYQARTLLGRMAGEDDLKGAIAFLASDAAAYVTGANLPVDGGYTAK